MNAILPISQAPGGSDAAQLNAPAPAASPPSRGANQDFAGALRDAGGKPARKGAVGKQQEAALSGSALPVPGNQPPPVPASPPGLTPSAPPAAVKTELLAAAQAADAAGAIAGPPAGAAGATPSAIPAAPTLPATAGSTAAFASNFDPAAALVSAPVGVAPRPAGPGHAKYWAGGALRRGAGGTARPRGGRPGPAWGRVGRGAGGAGPAATAGRIAQEVSSAAAAGAVDKRSHANSPDTSLSGASNDGSTGAAQLLTSNTAADSSPSPMFKVAAGVDTARCGQDVADKVAVMMDGD